MKGIGDPSCFCPFPVRIPEAQWQRCTVHFYRNVFSVVPRKHVRTVADMLKAIHACEDRQAAQDKGTRRRRSSRS
jgi:transposase-like protein